MIRELANSSIRAGLYIRVRDWSGGGGGGGETGLKQRVSAAMLTGSLGAILSNPVDVVKVRLLLPQLRLCMTGMHRIDRK